MPLAVFLSLDIADKLAGFAQFAIVLGIMVIVHELGHFLVAKACGVRVEAFAIGFGQRLFGIVHNGTDYRLNLFPVGGYVKMAGMELSGEAHTDDPGEFQNHPRWQRTLITLAGPVANFILAFGLLLGLYMLHNEIPAFINQPITADYVSPGSAFAKTGIRTGDRIIYFDNQTDPTYGEILNRSLANFNRDTPISYEHNGQRVNSSVRIEYKDTNHPQDFDFDTLGLVPAHQTTPIEVSSLQNPTVPAAQAGLQPHDRILSANGLAIHSVDALIAYMQDQGGKPLDLEVQRGTAILHLIAHPAVVDTQEGKGYRLGFAPVPPPVKVEQYTFARAAEASWHDNLKNSRLILDVLHRLFTRQVSVKSLSSPLGMGVQVHQAFEISPTAVILTMALISLNLGIFNLLPIPILDGGMITFLFIESVMRRDVSPQIKERVIQVAFVCILLFAAVVIFNDITKILPAHIKT